MKWIKNNWINIAIIIFFVFIVSVVGYKHEPWEDEIQSWLIARDASTSEIVWKISRYEGAFPLWFLTIKLFMSFNLSLKYFFIIPLIISTIGLIVFLFKVKCPIYFKILFPFTYFVIYQYAVIARNYSYLFLAFSLIAVFYNKRFEKTFEYILSLIFMSMISIHGMIISGILGLSLFIEIIKRKDLKRNFLDFLVLIIAWILEIIILLPPSDIYMNVALTYSLKEILLTIFSTILLTGGSLQRIYNIIITISMIYLIIQFILINKKDILLALVSVLVLMIFVRCLPHHLGIISYLIVFGVIINLDLIKEKNKYIDKVLIFICIVYIIGSAVSLYNDYKYKYNTTEDMAKYIKSIEDFENKKINGVAFYSLTLQAYFDKPLYDNWGDMTYYRYSIYNKDFYNYTVFDDSYSTYLLENNPDYVVFKYEDENSDSKNAKIIKYLKTAGYEEKYKTEKGRLFYKLSDYNAYEYVIFGKK